MSRLAVVMYPWMICRTADVMFKPLPVTQHRQVNGYAATRAGARKGILESRMVKNKFRLRWFNVVVHLFLPE